MKRAPLLVISLLSVGIVVASQGSLFGQVKPPAAKEVAAVKEERTLLLQTVGMLAASQVYQAYLNDPAVARFLVEANPAALAEIAARLDEAIRRGLWRPRSNQAGERLARIRKGEAA